MSKMMLGQRYIVMLNRKIDDNGSYLEWQIIQADNGRKKFGVGM